MIMYIQVLAGFVVLVGAAEVLVRGAVSLADRFGVSPLVIGMTVVAVGTSAPELVVSLDAIFAGASGLAVGNIVGSNIANVLLILGATCLFKPIIDHPGSSPMDGWPICSRATISTPAIAARRPDRAWAAMTVAPTEMPDRAAA